MDYSGGCARMLAGLVEASHLSAIEQLPALVEEHAAQAGLYDVLIYLADLQQEVLRLLTGHGRNAGEGADPELAELRIDGTLAGRAFQDVRILPKSGAGEGVDWWWVPLLDGTERLGVLRVSARAADEWTQENMRALASSGGAAGGEQARPQRLLRPAGADPADERRRGDAVEPAAAADLRQRGGGDRRRLEPAYEIGGDAFDYALAGERVHLSIFDAMGHDASAGLTSNLALAACRNYRRQGADLSASARGSNRS